jgi:predicted Zn-dependent peptidase
MISSIESFPAPARLVYDNGLTLLHQKMPHRASIALGVWLRAGARDEPAEHAGATHFLEHMLFKGTERRNSYDISASLESLGGHLDAFTAREHVCYYGRALEEHLPQALDVLSDVVTHSTLPDDELEREKEVVREEIFSYEDSPEEKVHDLLSEALWGADPLGRPILGTEQSVDAFTGDELRAFDRGRYTPGNLVVALAGSFDPAWAEEMVGKAFPGPAGAPLGLATTALAPTPNQSYYARDVAQLHLALARPALRNDASERYRLAVLATIVGGGMSSRLFQTLREQRGLAYSVYASTESYRDTGMVSIALGVKPSRGAEALDALHSELARFIHDGPTDEEIDSGKAQMRGSLLLGEESVSNHMYHLALDELSYGRYIPLATHLDEVARVTRADLIELAERFFTPDGWTVAAVGPEKTRDEVLAAARSLGQHA